MVRDKKNMPYIYGNSLDDVIRGQGYVVAQDRLFQLMLNKLASLGRISELVGERGLDFDKRMRTIGFRRAAIKHAAILDRDTVDMIQAYADGINEFVQNAPQDIPLEFRLAGLRPEPWSVVDTLAVIYFMGWGSAGNLKTEIVAQMLIEKIGIDRFKEISLVNTNIDDPAPLASSEVATFQPVSRGRRPNRELDEQLRSYLQNDDFSLRLGSNAWTVNARLSTTGKPILANDPHLDARILPGVFHPAGLIFGERRIVGVSVPGIPGVFIGRNRYVAVGLTNSYGDAQDLYVETVDPENPDHYLNGSESVPFRIVTETIRVKQQETPQGYREEELKIRQTERGPVVSGIFPDFQTDRLFSLRWAPFETMQPALGMDYLMRAKSVEDVRNLLRSVTAIHLNVTFADIHDRIGWQTTGRLPIRSRGNGTVPMVVQSDEDDWAGWIPYDRMPQQYQPKRGWLGNGNNRTIGPDYPYYVSSYFAAYYRYKRMSELLQSAERFSPADFWRFQRDDLNVIARKLVPIFVRALLTDPKTKLMGDILSKWDYRDGKNRVEPTLYHRIYERLALLTFRDELGEELALRMLNRWHFWQERFEIMITTKNATWFDDKNTDDRRETLEELIVKAGKEVQTELSAQVGTDMGAWRWGKVHRVEFVNPIRQRGFGKGLLGSGKLPMGGSVDTLYRSIYNFRSPQTVTITSALRMVVDLSDRDKILAVLPGGVTGRTFSSHQKDQIAAYSSGESLYWWFSDSKIEKYKRSELLLQPAP